MLPAIRARGTRNTRSTIRSNHSGRGRFPSEAASMRSFCPSWCCWFCPAVGIGQDASKPAKSDAAKPPAAKPAEPVAAARTGLAAEDRLAHPARRQPLHPVPQRSRSVGSPRPSGCTSPATDWPKTSTGRRASTAATATAATTRPRRSTRRTPRRTAFAARAKRRGRCAPSVTRTKGWNWSRASTPRPARRTSRAAARCWSAASVTGRTSTISCRWPTAARRCSSTTRCRPAASATRRSWPATCNTSHGHGLYQSGLLVTATCANCHGAHGIYRAADRRSTLYTGNVAATCGKCHRFIAERLQASVHGRGAGPGEMADEAGAGRQVAAASQLHLLPPRARNRLGRVGAIPPATAQPLRQLPRRSVQPLRHDHPRRIDGVGLPAGGQLLTTATARTASWPCTIRPRSVSGESRLTTCQKCHPYATRQFRPVRSARQLPRSQGQSGRLLGLPGAVDVVADDVRVLRAARRVLVRARHWWRCSARGGRRAWCPARRPTCGSCPCTGGRTPFCCCRSSGLALTGLPLKYSEHEWAKALAHPLGRF